MAKITKLVKKPIVKKTEVPKAKKPVRKPTSPTGSAGRKGALGATSGY